MRTPIFNVLSLAVPVLVGSVGLFLMLTARRATSLGEALGPLVILMAVLTGAAAMGELAAVVSLFRGERLGWLSWLGVVVNGALLLPAIYLLLGADRS